MFLVGCIANEPWKCHLLDSQSYDPPSACAYSESRDEDPSRDLYPKSDRNEACLNETSSCDRIDHGHYGGRWIDAESFMPLAFVAFGKKIVNKLNPTHARVRI